MVQSSDYLHGYDLKKPHDTKPIGIDYPVAASWSNKYCRACTVMTNDIIKGRLFSFPTIPRFRYIGASLHKGNVRKHYQCECKAEFISTTYRRY